MSATPDPLAVKIAALWERNKPVVRERLDLLERAVAELEKTGALSAELKSEAIGIAHKLAGSLGMFGHNNATEHARSIEIEWESAGNISSLRKHLDALKASLADALV